MGTSLSESSWRLTAAFCLAALSVSAATSAHATRVVIKGRVIDSKVEAPQFPTSRAECTQFNNDIGDLIKTVHEEHEVCLADKGNASESNSGTCSKPACQKLHDARDELTSARSKGYSECNAAVNERQRSDRWASSGYGTDMEAFVSAIKSGPISALKSIIKNEISNIIERTFGHASPAVKGGLKASMAAEQMVSSYQALQKACKEKSVAALNACNRELLNSIQRLPSLVPTNYSSDPGISIIQQAMMSRLNLMMRDTLDTMDRVSDQIDEVAEPNPALSRRRRSTPRIENN